MIELKFSSNRSSILGGRAFEPKKWMPLSLNTLEYGQGL